MEDAEVLKKIESIVDNFIIELYSDDGAREFAAEMALGSITATLILRGHDGRSSTARVLPEQAEDQGTDGTQ